MLAHHFSHRRKDGERDEQDDPVHDLEQHAHRDAAPPDTSSPRLATAFHGGRWLAINSIVYGLGHLRPPAVVNRHGRRQPAWNDLPDVPAVRPPSHARLG